MAIMHWKGHGGVRPVWDSSMALLKHQMSRIPTARRALGYTLNPTTSPRSFARDLARTKAQRLQTIIARRRRSVYRRMVFDHDTLDASVAIDMEIHREKEEIEMVVDSTWNNEEPSSAVHNSLDNISQFISTRFVEEVAPPEMVLQLIKEMNADVSMEAEAPAAAPAFAKVLQAEDEDSLMLSENALSAIEKVLHDADADGSGLSESPSADLLPKMAIEDDLVLHMEKRTAGVRLDDDKLPLSGLYSQAKLQRSCRSGYYRYEPYPGLPSLRLQQRRCKVVRIKVPESNNISGPDWLGDKTLVDEECSTSYKPKDRPIAEFDFEKVTVAPSEARGSKDALPERTDPFRHTLPQEKENQDDWLNQASDLYWERPFTPAIPSSPTLIQVETGIKELKISSSATIPEEFTKPERTDSFRHTLPQEKENQDDWLNQASDLYWERPFTPSIPSSPTLIQLETGIKELNISSFVTIPEEFTKPESPAACQNPTSPPSESHSHAPAPSQAHPSPQFNTSMPAPPTPIQAPPRVLHRELYHDKENWTRIPLDLEVGNVTSSLKRSKTLVRSVFGTLRTWVGNGWGSR